MTVFVLVHGTGHRGRCWQFLPSLQRAPGYEVYIRIYVTGLGGNSHLSHGLEPL